MSSFRASDHAVAALDVGFGREPEPAFTHWPESRVRRQGGCDVPYGLLGWGGAVGGSRTRSLRDTNALLRQLSYDSRWSSRLDSNQRAPRASGNSARLRPGAGHAGGLLALTGAGLAHYGFDGL